MSQILVDTDILIDVASNDAIAKVRLTSESQTSTLVVSTIAEGLLLLQGDRARIGATCLDTCDDLESGTAIAEGKI